MQSSVEIVKKLKALKPILMQKYFVERLGLFGSYVREEQTECSDVDIVVSFRKAVGWEFFDLQYFLENELQLKVDLITEKAIKQQIREEVLMSVKYL